MKQTAVEWIEKQLIEGTMRPVEIIAIAKAMEKEQSEKIYEFASWERFHNGHGQTFEEYWNKNFKSE